MGRQAPKLRLSRVMWDGRLSPEFSSEFSSAYSVELDGVFVGYVARCRVPSKRGVFHARWGWLPLNTLHLPSLSDREWHYLRRRDAVEGLLEDRWLKNP